MGLERRKNELGLLLNLDVRTRWLEEWLNMTVFDLLWFCSLYLVFALFIYLISFLYTLAYACVHIYSTYMLFVGKCG